MEFEDILSQVGGSGKFQKQLALFFFIPMSCVLSWISFDSLFLLSVPDHWCFDEDVSNSNLSVSKQRALLSPPADPSCSRYDVNYTEYLLDKDFTFINDTEVIPCSSGWQYDKIYYESTASTKWNLVCDHRYFASLVLTLENVGSLIFTPFYGFLADRWGRKKVYLLLTSISATTELVSVVVEDFSAFVTMRIIKGGVMPSVITMAFLLIIEIVDPEMRAHMNGLYNFFFTTGLCMLPLVAYLSRSWINLGLVCSITCAFNLIYYRFIPESPSWLISRGRYEEATTIMERIGEKNGKPRDRTDVLTEIQTLGRSIQKRREKDDRNSSYLLLASPVMRKRFLILSFCWIAFYSTYYGLMFNLRNLTGNEFLNFFLLCIVELPGNILFWFLMDRVGRRWTASIGLIVLGFVCLSSLAGFPHSDIIVSMIGKLISTGLFMVTDQEGTELFPTVVRSFGINTGKTLANALTAMIPFFADLGEYDKELPFVIMACISFVAGVLASFLPETLNDNLPQTIYDAEQLGKDQKFFSWIRKKGQISSNETLSDLKIQSSGDSNGTLPLSDEATPVCNHTI